MEIDDFVRELRAFDQRRTVVQTMRRRLRGGQRAQLVETRAAYLDRLPRRGGLGAWAARSTLSLRITYTGRSAGIRVRGARKSGKGKADLTGLDAGRVRHPSWGRRARGDWHAQAVTPRVFTDSVDVDTWLPTIDAVLDEALVVIRGA